MPNDFEILKKKDGRKLRELIGRRYGEKHKILQTKKHGVRQSYDQRGSEKNIKRKN